MNEAGTLFAFTEKASFIFKGNNTACIYSSTKVSSAIAEIKTAHILCQTYYTEILKQCGLFCVAHWHYFHQLQSFFQNILIDTWCDMHSKVGRFVYFDSFIYAAVEIRKNNWAWGYLFYLFYLVSILHAHAFEILYSLLRCVLQPIILTRPCFV